MRTTNHLGTSVVLCLALLLLPGLRAFAGPSADLEADVLSKIGRIYQQQGRINFSELYNSSAFSAEERNYLGRLYEVFFAIPQFLLSQQQSTGKIPTQAEISESFGIGQKSVALLLSLMEKDPRVPHMFTRDTASGEIKEIDAATIEAFVKAKGSDVKMAEWEGQPLPEFSLPTLQGDLLKSSELKGSPIVLYFWFSGCPPCVRIAPILAQLNREYGSRGVKFVGLNADDVLGIGTDIAARRDYVAKEGITFPVVNLDAATRRSFGQVNVFPTLFFVDREGLIRHHLVNFQDRETLESIIKELL
jgi:cytochrome c biogenesis protein CcmG/thiol:disulfide interchange protein DsbE